MKKAKFYGWVLFLAPLLALSGPGSGSAPRAMGAAGAGSSAATHVAADAAALNASAQGTALSAAAGHVYYVSSSGNNANSGAIDQPWKDIAYATCGGTYGCPCAQSNPNLIMAGDTLYLRAGEYHEHDLNIKNSGVDGSPITIKSYPGETAIINGDHISDIFNIGVYNEVNNVVFDGIVFKDAYRAGIRLGENYHTYNYVIQNCRFENLLQVPHDNSASILLQGVHNVAVRNCVIVGNGEPNMNYCGIQIFRGDGSVEISNCDISNVSTGVFYKHTSLGNMQTVIRNNYIHDNKTKGLWISSDHVLMENNLVINNFDCGISIWEDAGGTGGSNSSVLHNTVYSHTNDMIINWGGQLGPDGSQGARFDMIKNNVFSGYNDEHGEFSIWPWINTAADHNHGTVSDYNCYFNGTSNGVIREFNVYPIYTLSQWKTLYPTRDVHSVQGMPIFTGGANPTSIAGFALAAGSPGKNAASDGKDMGADVSLVGIQSLKLHGAPANQALYLSWDVNATLPGTSTWRIDYYTQTVTAPISITGITSPTRAYSLTGLTNYTWYTVTLNAMLDTTPILSDIVRVMPTDVFVYLPLVVRAY